MQSYDDYNKFNLNNRIASLEREIAELSRKAYKSKHIKTHDHHEKSHNSEWTASSFFAAIFIAGFIVIMLITMAGR